MTESAPGLCGKSPTRAPSCARDATRSLAKTQAPASGRARGSGRRRRRPRQHPSQGDFAHRRQIRDLGCTLRVVFSQVASTRWIDDRELLPPKQLARKKSGCDSSMSGLHLPPHSHPSVVIHLLHQIRSVLKAEPLPGAPRGSRRGPGLTCRENLEGRQLSTRCVFQPRLRLTVDVALCNRLVVGVFCALASHHPIVLRYDGRVRRGSKLRMRPGRPEVPRQIDEGRQKPVQAAV